MKVDDQVGASRFRIDLAVRDRRDPSRYLLGIECDGATYHSSRTARDRDLLRQLILRDMGWRLHRVWSTEWFHDREGAIQSILRSVEQAEAAPVEQLVQAPVEPSPDSSSKPDNGPSIQALTDSQGVEGQRTQTSQPQRKYLAGVAYQKYQPRNRKANRNLLLRSSNVELLAMQIAAIVEAEGPIHEDLLIERLKEIHAIERAGSNVQANIRQAIRRAAANGHVYLGQEKRFVWKTADKLANFRIPGDGVKRPIEQVPREEIELAILHIVEDQFGMMRDYMPTAAGRVFGIERVYSEAGDLVRDAIDGLIERGLLRISGPQVYLA